MPIPKPKAILAVDVRTFTSNDGKRRYVVFRTPAKKAADRAYHVFMEVEAKGAAMDCGSAMSSDERTPTHWDKLWSR